MMFVGSKTSADQMCSKSKQIKTVKLAKNVKITQEQLSMRQPQAAPLSTSIQCTVVVIIFWHDLFGVYNKALMIISAKSKK